MLWIYDNLRDKIGLGESEFKRMDFDEQVSLIFRGWDSQRVNPEDATSLGRHSVTPIQLNSATLGA